MAQITSNTFTVNVNREATSTAKTITSNIDIKPTNFLFIITSIFILVYSKISIMKVLKPRTKANKFALITSQ